MERFERLITHASVCSDGELCLGDPGPEWRFCGTYEEYCDYDYRHSFAIWERRLPEVGEIYPDLTEAAE